MPKRNYKTLALICSRRDSLRVPGKNRLYFSDILRKCSTLSWLTNIVVATDDEKLLDLDAKFKKAKFIKRPPNASRPHDSVFSIGRWAYYCLNKEFDIVILIFPNVRNFSLMSVGQATRLLINKHLNEVRTYDKKGCENGVIVMKKDWFLNGSKSVYCGAVISDAVEINTVEDLQ